MQTGQENSNNVVSLAAFNKDKKQVAAAQPAIKSELPAEEVFAETMRKNEEVRRKMAQDRAKANRSVLKSYRIKT